MKLNKLFLKMEQQRLTFEPISFGLCQLCKTVSQWGRQLVSAQPKMLGRVSMSTQLIGTDWIPYD